MSENDKYSPTILPPAGLLSNGRLHVAVSATGTGFMKREWIALTRWHADPVGDAHGHSIYLKDLDSGDFWSVGAMPVGIIGDDYAAIPGSGRFGIRHVHRGIEAVLDIAVAPTDDVEIRRLMLRDISGRRRRIRITGYIEVALNHPDADLAHPAFSKLFVQTGVLPDRRLLTASRRPRSNGETWPVMFHGMLGGDRFAWETDRLRFLGRGRAPRWPAAIRSGAPLSGTVGNVLDPILALDTTADIAPDGHTTIAFFSGAANDRESALRCSSRISNIETAAAILDAADARERSLISSLDIPAKDTPLFQALGAAILRGDTALRAKLPDLDPSCDVGSVFTKFGVPRDLPLIVLTSGETTGAIAFLARALKYWSRKGVDARLVILSPNPRLAPSPDSERIMSLDPKTLSRSDLAALKASARCVLGDQMPAVSAGPPVFAPAIAQSEPDKDADKWPQTADHDLRFWNGYGGFTADGSEYVIRMPWRDGELVRPPLPWINVVANEVCGFLISECGAGYTWCRNSQANRLTPWSNDPVSDPNEEAIYVRDDEDGSFWSPTPGPTPAPAAYEARHGFGYSNFTLNHRALSHETVMFVPRGRPLKCVRVRIKNTGPKRRKLSLFSYQRLVMGSVPGANPMIITRNDTRLDILTAVNAAATDFRGGIAFSKAVLSGCDASSHHATCDRLAFIGRSGHAAHPLALTGPSPLAGESGIGHDPCFAHQIRLEIDPGQVAECTFLLGEAPPAASAVDVANCCKEPAEIEAALQDVIAFWKRLTATIQVETPSPAIDLMLNGWLLYQNLSCRIWGRSAFYQSGGAYGYRDQLQDTSCLAAIRPDLARDQILLHAAHQFAEGDVLHWWHPEPIEAGLRTRFSDDLLWLPFATAHYIKTTGDASILDARMPFVTAPLLEAGQDEVYLKPRATDEIADLYEHCTRAIDRSLTRGEHGLPLMGTGDWNDGMNRVGREGRGESVWLGFFICHVLDQFIPICEARSDLRRIEAYGDYRKELVRALNDAGWDGAWYRRAYYDDGSPLGSLHDTECRIDALAQAWAVISGVADPDRATMAMASLKRELVSEKHGIIRLLTPPFEKTEKDPGYIKGYVAGVRENGGQYTHAACWVIRALAELGQRDCATSFLEMILPITHAASQTGADIYKVEPYVVAADIYGCEPHVGRGGWTWYTGSAGWMYRVAIESILGLLIIDGKRLAMAPRVPDNWPAYRIDYRTPSGAILRIAVENPDRQANHIRTATFDGEPVPPDALSAGIPLPHAGSHTLRIVLGGP